MMTISRGLGEYAKQGSDNQIMSYLKKNPFKNYCVLGREIKLTDTDSEGPNKLFAFLKGLIQTRARSRSNSYERMRGKSFIEPCGLALHNRIEL